MKIIQTAEGIALKVTEQELINIYASILSNLANHKKIPMPITAEMAKTLTDYYNEKPF